MISVIGASSAIGRQFLNCISSDEINLISYFNNNEGLPKKAVFLDMTRFEKTNSLKEVKNGTVLFCSDFHYPNTNSNVFSIKTSEINSTMRLLRYLHDNYNKIIFLSSQSVFSSNTPRPEIDAMPEPKSPYGFSKLILENFIRAELENSQIIRFGKVITKDTPFIEKSIRKINNKEAPEFKDNWIIAPVSVLAAAEKLSEIVLSKENIAAKVLHICSNDSISYFNFMSLLFKNLELDKIQIKKQNTAEEEEKFFDLSVKKSAQFIRLDDLTVEKCLSDIKLFFNQK